MRSDIKGVLKSKAPVAHFIYSGDVRPALTLYGRTLQLNVQTVRTETSAASMLQMLPSARSWCSKFA